MECALFNRLQTGILFRTCHWSRRRHNLTLPTIFVTNLWRSKKFFSRKIWVLRRSFPKWDRRFKTSVDGISISNSSVSSKTFTWTGLSKWGVVGQRRHSFLTPPTPSSRSLILSLYDCRHKTLLWPWHLKSLDNLFRDYYRTTTNNSFAKK